jgi:hypothetical protein
MLSSCKSLAIGTVKGLGALALGGSILWQVVNQCGSIKGVAYVHVATPEVDVTIDDQRYRVETSWESPIVCELRPGRHLLRMLRSGCVLFEQEFTLDRGQEVVLTAWEELKEKSTEEHPITAGSLRTRDANQANSLESTGCTRNSTIRRPTTPSQKTVNLN